MIVLPECILLEDSVSRVASSMVPLDTLLLCHLHSEGFANVDRYPNFASLDRAMLLTVGAGGVIVLVLI